jgi:hypothetical protein
MSVQVCTDADRSTDVSLWQACTLRTTSITPGRRLAESAFADTLRTDFIVDSSHSFDHRRAQMRDNLHTLAIKNRMMTTSTAKSLSPSQTRPVPRRGLSRTEAALYLGISPSKFDELVADGRVSRPRLIDTRKVWDVFELDLAFEDLPRDDDKSAGNSWADR